MASRRRWLVALSQNLRGRADRTTDARGVTLAYTYDALNRKTGEHLGSASGTKLASWQYDTLAKGQLTSRCSSGRCSPPGC